MCKQMVFIHQSFLKMLHLIKWAINNPIYPLFKGLLNIVILYLINIISYWFSELFNSFVPPMKNIVKQGE